MCIKIGGTKIMDKYILLAIIISFAGMAVGLAVSFALDHVDKKILAEQYYIAPFEETKL
jgi:hypothetical protein